MATKDEINLLKEMHDELVGTLERPGFISEMHQFKKDTSEHLERIDRKFEKVNPIIDFMGHWKFISGLAVGITGFMAGILAIMYYIIILIQSKGG